MEQVYFQIHGDFITDHLRNLYEEGSALKSWKTFETITDNKDIFRDIIKGRKGFNGINELELVDVQNEDLTDKVLSSLVFELNQYKTEFYKIEDIFKTKVNDLYLEDNDITLEDYMEYKNNSYVDLKNKIENIEENLTFIKTLFNYSEEDLTLACLQKYKSEDLNSSYGWITEKGWFIPVPFAGHDQFINDFNDKMKTNFSVEMLEKKWVRITNSLGTTAISAYNFNLKPKQSITLMKWLLHHNAIKDGESLSIFGFGEAIRNGKNIKFVRYS